MPEQLIFRSLVCGFFLAISPRYSERRLSNGSERALHGAPSVRSLVGGSSLLKNQLPTQCRIDCHGIHGPAGISAANESPPVAIATGHGRSTSWAACLACANALSGPVRRGLAGSAPPPGVRQLSSRRQPGPLASPRVFLRCPCCAALCCAVRCRAVTSARRQSAPWRPPLSFYLEISPLRRPGQGAM